jgi:integrase
MPKPLLLRRSSGLYARFLLPSDLRANVGTRFFVRSLGKERGDMARLTAARMGYALAQAIAVVRSQGLETMDTKKLLEGALAAAARGDVRTYELSVPGVVSLRADGPEDHARALEALHALRVVIPGLTAHASAPVPAAPVAAPTGPMLHASAKLFLLQYGQLGRAAATKLETEHTLRLFIDLIHDLPLNEVGATHIDVFREAMSNWPARARVMPEYKKLTARQIVERGRKQGVPGLNVRTIEKHLDRLRVFFNWAVQRSELTRNPIAGLRLQTTAEKYESVRRGYKAQELRVLFDPERRAFHCAADPMFFWLPVLALCTGARVGELAQLSVSDLDQVAGVWGIHITPEALKRVKNKQSKRFVPMPARILEMGFLAYAGDVKAADFTDLFPGGSAAAKNGLGDRVSRWFNRTYLRKACGIQDTDVCFHSFRHTLLTAADRLGFSEAQAGALTGHAARSVQAKHYIDGATVVERQRRIDAIANSFDLPVLAGYLAGQFADRFGEIQARAKRARLMVERAERLARAHR